MFWIIWSAFDPPRIFAEDIERWWRTPDHQLDVAWLGEAAWVNRVDNMGLGLR